MAGGRRFSLSSPDWGQDHLSLDAIVAYVDDELTVGPHARAEAHLRCCRECRAEVVAQRQARAALRGAGGPCLPSSLLRSLRSIPVDAELPPPPPGLGITADGEVVLLRDVPQSDGRARGRRGDGGPRRLSRRARFGAVSGLAIGALAVGALTTPGATAPSAPGALGGPVLDIPVQAQMSAVHAVPVVSPAVAGRPGPVVANPAVAGASRVNAAATDTTTVAATADAASSATPGAATDDSSAVLDASLRARLDHRPIAFYRTR